MGAIGAIGAIGAVGTFGLLASPIQAETAMPETKPASPDSTTLEQRVEREIVELHVFLEEWSNAVLPDSDLAFARFGDVLAPSFTIIGPDSVPASRDAVVGAIRSAHGRWSAAPGKIRIEDVRIRQSDASTVLATYEEWHERDGQTTGRLSSIQFGVSEDAPNGLEWLHLHEGWLPGHAPTAGE